MKLKKFTAVALCATMVLSLTACTSPKDFFSKILTGNSGTTNNGTNAVAEATITNKDAVFAIEEEAGIAEMLNLDSSYYVDYNMKSYNGKVWLLSTEYVFAEGYEDYYENNDEVMPLDESQILRDGDETVKEPAVENDPNEEIDLISADGDAEIISADGDYNYDDEYPVDDYVPQYQRIKLYNFTSTSDVNECGTIDLEDNEWISSSDQYLVGKNNNVYFMTTMYDENGEALYRLKEYTLDGQLVNEIKMENKSEDDWFYINRMVIDNNDNIFLATNKSINVYDKDLKKVSSTPLDENSEYIDGMVTTPDGTVIMVENVYTGSGDNWKSEYFVYSLDINGNKTKMDLGEDMYGKSISSGVGYDILYSTSTSVNAISLADKKSVEVVNFFDSDINPYDFNGAIFIDKDRFVTSTTDDEGYSMLTFYKKVPADQVVDKQVITISVYGLDYSLSKRVSDYNKTNTQYKIKVVDYSQYDSEEDSDAGLKRFNTDLTSGNNADIIIPSTWGTATENLIAKGVFTDLTPIMEAGNGVKKEDLVECAQTTFADGDKLYLVFPIYSVSCFEMKKSLYDGELTIEDMIEWEKKTGKKALSETYTSSEALYQLMSYGMSEFLDPKTGKCNFDSDEFKALLDYAKSYPNNLPEDYWENYNWDEYMNMYRKDNALVSLTGISSIADCNYNSAYTFGEETVYTGITIGDSNGVVIYPYDMMGISAKSKNKEAAWEFINSCFSEEFYEANEWELPSLETEFDKRLEAATQKPYYLDEDGSKVEYDRTYYYGEQEIVVEPLSSEKAKEIKEFVTKSHGQYSYDSELLNIVTEETESFFQGQKTSDEVAKVIQSRLQIYVNEKK